MAHSWVDLHMSSRADCANHTWPSMKTRLAKSHATSWPGSPITRSEVLISTRHSVRFGHFWSLAQPERIMIHHIS